MAGNRNSELMAAGPLYICHGAKHDFTVKAAADSPWSNQGVSLNKNPAEPELPVTTDPNIAVYQLFQEPGATWTIDCPHQPANAEVKAFQLWAQTEFTSPAYKVDVSLGHHRIDFVDASGNEQFQVIEYGEEAILKAREISYYTKEAMPFPAKWKLEEQDLQPADPDATGWVTPYNFKPTKAGIHLINVTVPSLYYEQGYFRKEMPVHALALTPWGNDALIQVNDKTEPDVLERGVVCTRGKPLSLKLLNENLLLKGSSVSLNSADAKALGLTFNPDLGVEKEMLTQELSWTLNSPASAKSGLFKLQMHCSKLKKDWDITGHLLSANLEDEVAKVEVEGAVISDFGAVFFREEARSLTVTFADSMRGLSVALEETGNPGNTYNPALKTFRKIPEDLKLVWQVTGGAISSVFTLKIVCADVETPLTIPSRVLSKITADEFQSLTINGQPVDLARPELLFFRAGVYEVELIPKPASSLIGLNVALKKGSGAELGMTYDPPLDRAVPLTAQGLKWKVTAGRTQSGLFELLFNIPQVEQSMLLTCRLLSINLADEAEVKIDGVAVPAGGNWFYRDKAQTVTLTPKSGSPLAGLPVTLTCSIKSGLDIANVVSAPAFGSEQTTYSWAVTGKTKSGMLQLALAGKGMTTPITLAISKLVSNNLIDEADVRFDNVSPVGAWFYRDKAQTVTLVPKLYSPLAGLPVTLTCTIKSGLDVANVVSAPAFGSEQTTHSWAVTGRTKSGTFQLTLAGKGMTTPITLTISKLISNNLADEADVKIGGVAVPAGGNWFYRDKPQTVTLTPRSGSPIAGLAVTHTCAIKSGLDVANVTSAPAFGTEQTSHSWAVTGKAKSGTFQLTLAGKGMTMPITVVISKLLSTNLADEVTVLLDGVAIPASGIDFLGGATKKLTLSYKNANLLAGIPLALDWVPGQGLLHGDLVSQPPLRSLSAIHEWRLTSAEKVGAFKLKLFTNGEAATLLTPTSKLVAPYKLRYLALVNGVYVELPPPPVEVTATIGLYNVLVRVTKFDGSPVVGVPVIFYAQDSHTETYSTGANGIAISATFVTLAKKELSAVATLDGREYSTSLLLRGISPI
ncbi:hypothetical protein AN403_4252 [Pseudomonas fluorescens]|uniref:Uncharacterized protein n=1 Tax=Pseudomonas fluorescens TaxID=294 RepID=A0A0P8Z4B9_PSEFL|nr:hypothetical protein [Pseudomonas fluorescens]KPU59974.1 hypothetical protein AN403_4252 [Pseudomonas fluorescens]